MIRDPLSHRRYTQAATAWLAHNYGGGTGTCVLCGRPVDTTLPRTHKWGPTIEHTLPVRTIRAMARTNAEALTLALDQTLWRLAHHHCQRKQGGQVRTKSTPTRWRRSRAW